MLHLRKVSYFSVFCNSDNVQFIDVYSVFVRCYVKAGIFKADRCVQSVMCLSCDLSCEEVSYQT